MDGDPRADLGRETPPSRNGNLLALLADLTERPDDAALAGRFD